MIFLLLLVSTWALADEVPWYQGERVSQVLLEAPEGGLPAENPLPLLRVQEGVPLDLKDVRQDVVLLYQIGHFAAVEAVAIPWLSPGPDGEILPTVVLKYQVVAAPRVRRISIEASSRTVRRHVESLLPVQEGEVFYDERSASLVDLLTEGLDEAGWPEAEVSIELSSPVEGQRTLSIKVQEGPSRQISVIHVAGEVVRDDAHRRQRRAAGWVTSSQVRRWLWWEGVRTGRRLSLAEVEAARGLVVAELSTRGWRRPNADVWFLPVEGETHRRPVSLIVNGGERLVLKVHGLGMPRGDELEATVAHVPGVRVDEVFTQEVASRIEARFESRGFRASKVEARLEPLSRGQRLVIQGSRGPLSTLRKIDVSIRTGDEDGLTGMGANSEDAITTFSPSFIGGAMREAAPETVGDGIVSAAGIERSLRGVTELYRGHGFLEAEVELIAVESLRSRLGIARAVVLEPVELRIQVIEGPRTMLQGLWIDGDLGLAQKQMMTASEGLLGEPYGPAVLDDLARELVEIYREEGYLQADARVETVVSVEGHSAEARVRLNPGEQIRMRSLVIQGHRRTRSRVIEREVELALGEPITSLGLAQTRSQLYGLDLFRIVQIDLVGEDNRSRDVFLQLEERQNILLEAGGGMSTDIGALARGRAMHRNLFGLGHRLSALGEVGYAWQRGEVWRLDLQAPVWRIGMLYEAPYLPVRNQGLVVEAVIGELVQEPTWRLNRTGVSVGLHSRGFDWGETWVDYRVQWRHLEDVDPGALVAQDPWLESLRVSNSLEEDLVLPSETRLHMGPEVLVRVDRRDDPYNAASGILLTSQLSWNHGPLAGPATIRSETRLVVLHPVGPVILAMVGRGGVGWAQGGYTLPLDDRFYLGGSSLRGFEPNSVGPANLAARSDIPFSSTLEPVIESVAIRSDSSHWVPTGGDSLFALQLEARVPLNVLGMHGWDSTTLVAFTDWGHVGFVDSSVETTSQLRGLDPFARGSAGLGLKWATPVGPATIELGVNLNPLDERAEPRFYPNFALGEL